MTIRIARDGTDLAQYPENSIQALVDTGAILETDHYWCDGMPEWRPVSERWTKRLAAPTAAAVPKAPDAPAARVEVTTKNTGSLVMGICAIVLGVMALLGSWVPFLNILAIPIAIIGVLLAGIGLLLALFKRGRGALLPILGGVINGIAFAVIGAVTVGTATVMESRKQRTEVTQPSAPPSQAEAPQLTPAQIKEAEELDYIVKHVELFDLESRYFQAVLDGRVPGVLFKIRNNGERTLTKVWVRVYFKDATGKRIAEEDFLPVNTQGFRATAPLRPGYIWQIEQGKFFTAKSVPSEWAEGSIEAVIREIEFEK